MEKDDPVSFWMRLRLLAAFGIWGVSLIALVWSSWLLRLQWARRVMS